MNAKFHHKTITLLHVRLTLGPNIVLSSCPEEITYENYLNDTNSDDDRALEQGPPHHTIVVTVLGVPVTRLTSLEVVLGRDNLG